MENNTKPTNEKSLLKLLQKLKSTGLTVSNFGKKKIFPLIAAGSIAFILTSCNVNEIQTDIGSSTNSEWTDSSNTTDPSLSTDTGSNGTDTSGGNLTEDKLSKYSPLVQEMLTEEYYINLLVRAQQDPSLYSSPYFDPHPYTFLEEQGHDIEKVKAGELRCKTLGFTSEEEPNTLHLATYIENAGGYYTEYMLEYTLTDEEMADFKLLNSSPTSLCYVHSMFINDWISANKPVKILSEMKVEVNTHDYIANYLSNTKEIETLVGGSNYVDFVLTDFDSETRNYNIYAFPKGTTYNNVKTSGNLCYLHMWGYTGTHYENNILSIGKTSKIKVNTTELPNVQPQAVSVYNGQYFELSKNSAVDITTKD